jgi:hypothetical protein
MNSPSLPDKPGEPQQLDLFEWAEKQAHPRGFHAAIRESTRAEAGYPTRYSIGFGSWPCLKARYVQIAFHRWRLELWHGLPSYRSGGHYG